MKAIIIAVHKVLPNTARAEFEIPEQEADKEVAYKAAHKFLLEELKTRDEDLVVFFSYVV